MPEKKWTREMIVAVIQILHVDRYPLHSGGIRKTNRPLLSATLYIFGSWKKAIEAAGIEYRAISRQIFKHPRRSRNRSMCIKAIQSRYLRGLPLSAGTTRKQIGWLVSASTRFFGSWDNALVTAGLNPDAIRMRPPQRSWNQAKVIQALKKRAKDGLPVNSEAVAIDDVGLVFAARSQFGSYPDALRAAGFDASAIHMRNEPMSEAEIIAVLKGRHKQGLPINYEALSDEKKHRLLGSIRSRFKTYRAAILAAGFDYDKVRLQRKWTPQIVLTEIKSLVSRGEPLSAGYISAKYKSLHHAGSSHFTSWRKAVEAAGYDYDAILHESRRKGHEKNRATRAKKKTQ